jgi:hypothetical protein
MRSGGGRTIKAAADPPWPPFRGLRRRPGHRLVRLRFLSWVDFVAVARDGAVPTIAIRTIVAWAEGIARPHPAGGGRADPRTRSTGCMPSSWAVAGVLMPTDPLRKVPSAILIMRPKPLSAAMGTGFDPIRFGIFMAGMIEVAFIKLPAELTVHVSRGVLPLPAPTRMTVAALQAVPERALPISSKWRRPGVTARLRGVLAQDSRHPVPPSLRCAAGKGDRADGLRRDLHVGPRRLRRPDRGAAQDAPRAAPCRSGRAPPPATSGGWPRTWRRPRAGLSSAPSPLRRGAAQRGREAYGL